MLESKPLVVQQLVLSRASSAFALESLRIIDHLAHLLLLFLPQNTAEYF